MLHGVPLWNRAVGLHKNNSWAPLPFSWAPRTLRGRKLTFQQLTQEFLYARTCDAGLSPSFVSIYPPPLSYSLSNETVASPIAF